MDGITPRVKDGRISRADAARLAGVDDDTISAWISRGRLKDVSREGRRVWLSPAEVIDAEFHVHARERARDERRREHAELLEALSEASQSVA